MPKPSLKILNNKEIKQIKSLLKEQFGFDDDLSYVFLMNEKDRIYITTKDISRINFERLRVNTIGLYFGQLKEGKLRLSIDGTQLLGNKVKKNVFEVEDNKAMEWLKGQDIEIGDNVENNTFVVLTNNLKNKNDFIGCGKYTNGKVLNFVSKPRRLKA